MATLDDQLATLQQNTTKEDKPFEWFGGEDAGWARSMAAAIPSGIFKIFEGAATLGAALMDLGVDKDRVEAVEQYFADINPFDEAAGATGIGKITELIVNIGLPGGLAFKAASGLGRATLAAKKTGKYITTGEKARRFGQGMLGAGTAESIFVGNVEEAGTFGDWLGGPTEVDRDTGDPGTELLNRLKFGVEGAAFTGAFGGVGKLIGKMRASAGTSKAITGKSDFSRSLNKGMDRLSSWFRSRGLLPQEGYDTLMKKIGAEATDTSAAEEAMRDIDNIAERITRGYKKVAIDKIDKKVVKDNILKEMNDVLLSGSSGGRILNPAGRRLYQGYKNATYDPISNSYKGRYKTENQFMKDLIKAKPDNLKKYTKELNPDRKLRPIFGLVDEFAKDPKTGRPYGPGSPNKFKTGEQLYDVQIDRMNTAKVKNLEKTLINKYQADPADVKDLLGHFVGMRSKWGELFTSMGRRLNPDGLAQFEEMLPKYINDVLDRGYDVFKNNRGQWTTAGNYRPTKAIITEAIKDFKRVAGDKIDPKTGKRLILSDELAEQMVLEVWRGASLPKGFKLGDRLTGQVRWRAGEGAVPDFMQKSLADKITQKTVRGMSSTDMSEITGVARPIIQKLLGKAKNPMSTIVEGTNNLSNQIRSNEFFDNLIFINNGLKTRYDEWLSGYTKADGTKVPPRSGPEPRIPFLYNNTGEARKYAGGITEDFKMIGGLTEDGARAIKLDKWLDPLPKKQFPEGALKDIDETRVLKAAGEEVERIINPVNGKVALTDYANAFTKTQNSSKSIPTQLYNNLILYPKGMSQMAKTILAPFTHVRNFVSAAAFAGANGILPFGNTKDVKAAWNALQVLAPGTRKSNQFYRELLDLGVVNSQVQLGDLRRLLEDVDFGGVLNRLNSDYGVNRLLRRLSKIKKGAQDAYTAEDDFWKIFTYLGEKSRLKTAYEDAGLKLGQEFIDANGAKQIFNDEYLKIASANLVKNNVPNYAMVSEFVKGLRKLPIGNFVAFPAEIIRTSANIVETALKEINYSTVINGKTVNPLRTRGIQRLTGMALTTAALPLGTVAAAQAIYDISKDEVDAMRRYVAEWSKNSTLIPFKDDEGNLSYIDFSHLNAYDTVTRPIQTIVNAVNEGRADEDGLIDDFVLGLIESTKELGQPFISESIWTDALQDVSPILGRGGRDATGRAVWNPEDSLGDKMYKGVAHLIEAVAPLNWKQLNRIGLSMWPVDSQGRFDERGNEYEFGNELAGIAGMRRVEVKPERSFNYKITDYKKGIRNSRNLFTSATLKGGPITPKEIVDAYINANRALYRVNRGMYQDMNAARILGMSEDLMSNNMENRGERKAFNALVEANFRPLKISRDVKDLFEIRSQELGMANPFDRAQDVIERIADVLEAVPLTGDFFPDIQNPLDTNILPDLVGALNNQLPPLPSSNLQALNTGTQYGNVNTNVNVADQYAALFPGDATGKLAAQRRNKINQTANRNLLG